MLYDVHEKKIIPSIIENLILQENNEENNNHQEEIDKNIKDENSRMKTVGNTAIKMITKGKHQ